MVLLGCIWGCLVRVMGWKAKGQTRQHTARVLFLHCEGGDKNRKPIKPVGFKSVKQHSKSH